MLETKTCILNVDTRLNIGSGGQRKGERILSENGDIRIYLSQLSIVLVNRNLRMYEVCRTKGLQPAAGIIIAGRRRSHRG